MYLDDRTVIDLIHLLINLIQIQGKRGLTDSSVNREVDIESLVDSVIDEHMNNKPDSNSNNREYFPPPNIPWPEI